MNLLDYDDEHPEGPAPEAPSEWQEVPAARFLSWTHGEQMAYCAARDYDAAEHADSAEESAWHVSRATMYEGMIK